MDPNVLITSLIVSTVTSAAAWLWNKLRGNKAIAEQVAYIRRILDAVVPHEIEEALEQQLSAIATRYRIEEALWGALERCGVPKSKIATQVVHELAELGMQEFRRRLRELEAEREVPKELERLEQATKGIVDAFEPPPPDKRTVPPLGLDIEIVK